MIFAVAATSVWSLFQQSSGKECLEYTILACVYILAQTDIFSSFKKIPISVMH